MMTLNSSGYATNTEMTKNDELISGMMESGKVTERIPDVSMKTTTF